MNSDDSKYELYERVAILLENNDAMTEEQALEQAEKELKEREGNV